MGRNRPTKSKNAREFLETWHINKSAVHTSSSQLTTIYLATLQSYENVGKSNL